MRLQSRKHLPHLTSSFLVPVFNTLFFIGLTGGAYAQNALIDLPVAPSGFSSASSIFTRPPRKAEPGLTVSTTLSTSYDSNVTQGDGSDEAPRKSDVIITPGANVIYATEGRHWIVGGNYGVSYDEYLEQNDFSGLNHNLSGFLGYRGGRFIVTYTSSFASNRGLNRYYAGEGQLNLIETFVFQNSLTTRYTLSPKTSLVGTLVQSSSDVRTEGYSDTASFDANLAALWSLSALTDIGPGVRYTLRTGENQDDRTGIGPTINLNYQLSTKVALRSRIGVQFVEMNDSSDTTASWSVGAKYQASKLWGLNLTLFRDSQANPGQANSFDEVTNLRLGYERKVRRLTFNAGAGYEMRRSESSSETSTGDFDYLTLDSSLVIPVLSDELDLILSLRYRDLSADGETVSWDAVQCGVGVSKKF